MGEMKRTQITDGIKSSNINNRPIGNIHNMYTHMSLLFNLYCFVRHEIKSATQKCNGRTLLLQFCVNTYIQYISEWFHPNIMDRQQ